MPIDRQADLDALAADLAAAGRFAFDTEFISEGRYRPDLCLVQVACRGHVVAVDPFAVDLAPFLALLGDPDVRKIVHAGRQDLMIFYDLTSEPAQNVVDTQVAAALLGYGDSIGLSKLVEAALGERMPHAESFTDWSQRPLSATQVEYALDDVRHLEELDRRLEEALEARGRRGWLAEELRELDDHAYYRRDPDVLYRRIKGTQKLSRRELAILRELVRWREAEAESANRPRGRILTDDVLAAIARRKPRDRRALVEMRGVHPRAVDQFGPAIGTCIETAQRLPEEALPEPIEAVPKDATRALAVDLLEALLKARARELEIGPAYLGTRSQLYALIEHHRAGTLASARLPMLSGWRKDLVGAELIGLLDGRVTMSVDPDTDGIRIRSEGAT